MPEPFAHLHLHSHYSLLDSAIRPAELMRQVAALGMSEVALTDHGNLFGTYEFYSAAREVGVRPVLGCEVYVAPGLRTDRTPAPHGGKPYSHLVLLAENQKGWRNLMELVTSAYLEGFYHRPRIDRELLSRHAEGLIGLSACLSGEVSRRILAGDLKGARHAAEELREILGQDNFFLEIQDHGLAEEAVSREGMRAISEATGIPVVATNDCHFHRREDVEAHRVLIGIGQNKTLAELASAYAYNDEFYVKSPAEVERLFGQWPGALARTAEIARRCHVSFPSGEFHLPRYPVPDNRPADAFLEELAQQGLAARLADGRRRRHADSEYWARLEFELGVIGTMGFQGYFLVVWDFIRYAREHAIPVGPGRGSAAGSLVAYALRITDIDPLEYDLLFERFLNPDRISMPDIDIDFCQRRRDEVIAHVRRLYGEQNVSQIATFNVLQARSCIRDVGRVMGMSFSETDRIAKLVPETLGIKLEDAVKNSPRLAEAIQQNSDVARLIEIGKKLEGLARHCGVHAAGVVIAPRPVREIVPLYRTSRDEVVSQFDKDVIEKLGLLKMDFLGLKTLTVIDDCLASLRAAGIEPPDFSRTGLDDPAVYALFKAGDTDGVFQFESSGMRELLRMVQPSRFEELAALNALYRPGPMQWAGDFADRKHGRQKISYLFPELEEVLAETYGVIVYQEQVMRIAQRIAGFSMARADTLRKAMGKKQKQLIDEQGEHFVSGAVAKGFPRDKVQALWQMIGPFAQYGFNKSHSVAYAYVAYQTAYLKAHHREHFWAAMLSSEIANTEKLAAYVSLLVNSGVRVLGPDINASQVAFTVEGDAIRVGLGAVKGVGEAASQAVVQARAQAGGRIRSVPQLLRALPERAINRKVVECLARAGAFDSIHPNRSDLLANLDRFIDQAARQRQAIESGQGFLFGLDDDEDTPRPDAPTAPADRDEILQGERETLGFYLSGHPLDRWERVLRDLRAVKLAEIQELAASGAESVTVAGLVTGLKVRPIKDGRNQGRRMASFTLEDQTSSIRVVAFADAFERVEKLLADGAALLVTAAVRRQDAEYVELGLEEAVPLEGIESRRAAAVRVEIDLTRHGSEAELEHIHDVVLAHEGRVSLRLRLLGDGWRAELIPTRVLGVDPRTLIPELNALLGPGHVELLLG
ncbi:MAG TPA: DNA polymerase III subunit alpha [Thermoanaerobaculaceae bacterium]|nr:DNA polymerase III subunit alpha [Thermoanaerobaculaceae bacterium]HRS16756.1 DNA polymerase III subunit alpha [Thermoanaerobaculaceae bacterium]